MATAYAKHMARNAVIPALHGAGVLRVLHALKTRDRTVSLAFHDTDRATFTKQAEFLVEHAEIIDIETFLARSRVPRGKPLVTLTFDDGYRTFVTDVVPVLKQHGIPATWFIPTMFVDSDDVFWFSRLQCAVTHTKRTEIDVAGKLVPIRPWNRGIVYAALSRAVKKASEDQKQQLLADLLGQLGQPPDSAIDAFRIVSSKQLGDLSRDPVAAKLITVGSHTHTHPQMSQLDDAALDYELTHSKELLERWTGRPVRHFAYPSGDYDDRILNAMERNGYQSSWTTEPRFTSESDAPHQMPRVSVDAGTIGLLSAQITLAGKERAMPQPANDRKTRVRDHFDSYALDNRWGELYNPKNPLSHSFLARRAKTVEMLGAYQGGKLLDIGCGTGALMELVAKDTDYFAMDNAQNMVDVTRGHAKDLGLKANVQVGDAQALPFESNTFDSVVGLGLIEYFDEPEKVVSEAVRVAKPGARLVFNVPLRFNVNRFMEWTTTPLRALSRTVLGKKVGIEHGMYSKSEFRRLFTNVGCRVVEERVYNISLLPYPLNRFMPGVASKVSGLVEDRDGLDIFATGILIAVEKPKTS